jgi:hypothetical protein
MEHWKPIPNTNREVSDRGRIRTPGKGFNKLTINVYGYATFGVKINGKAHCLFVHLEVLKAFVGPCPPGHQCRHLNGKSAVNRLSNLKWGTPKKNEQDKIKHGTSPHGERNGRAKLTRKQVNAIRRAVGPRGLGKQLASHYSISKGHVSELRAGQYWD